MKPHPKGSRAGLLFPPGSPPSEHYFEPVSLEERQYFIVKVTRYIHELDVVYLPADDLLRSHHHTTSPTTAIDPVGGHPQCHHHSAQPHGTEVPEPDTALSVCSRIPTPLPTAGHRAAVDVANAEMHPVRADVVPHPVLPLQSFSCSFSSSRLQEMAKRGMPVLYPRVVKTDRPSAGVWRTFALSVFRLRVIRYTAEQCQEFPALACHISPNDHRFYHVGQPKDTILTHDAHIGQLLWDKYLRWEYLLPACLKIIGEGIQDRSVVYGVPPFLSDSEERTDTPAATRAEAHHQQQLPCRTETSHLAVEREKTPLITASSPFCGAVGIPERYREPASQGYAAVTTAPHSEREPVGADESAENAHVPPKDFSTLGDAGTGAAAGPFDFLSRHLFHFEPSAPHSPQRLEGDSKDDGEHGHCSRHSSTCSSRCAWPAEETAESKKLKLYHISKEVCVALIQHTPIFQALSHSQLRAVVQAVLVHLFTHDVREGPPGVEVSTEVLQALEAERLAMEAAGEPSASGRLPISASETKDDSSPPTSPGETHKRKKKKKNRRSKPRKGGVQRSKAPTIVREVPFHHHPNAGSPPCESSLRLPSSLRCDESRSGTRFYWEFNGYGYTCPQLVHALQTNGYIDYMFLRVKHLRALSGWWWAILQGRRGLSESTEDLDEACLKRTRAEGKATL